MWITVKNWEKMNPRKDVKSSSWFRLEHRMISEHKIWSLNDAEFRAWMYVLSMCSQEGKGTIEINPEHAARVCNVKAVSLNSMAQKLQLIQEHPVDVTDALRERDGDDTRTCSTDVRNERTNVHSANADRVREILSGYPQKDGNLERTKGIEKLARMISSPEDLDLLARAVQVYASYCIKKGWVKTNYVRSIPSFATTWRDWLEQAPAPARRMYWNPDTQQNEEVPLDNPTS